MLLSLYNLYSIIFSETVYTINEPEVKVYFCSKLLWSAGQIEMFLISHYQQGKMCLEQASMGCLVRIEHAYRWSDLSDTRFFRS